MRKSECLVTTERRNPASIGIDTKTTEEILSIINAEDQKVPLAVKTAIPNIAVVVDGVVDAFRRGGRLFYIGAGTSGRLGVLDASECPPTYGVDPSLVQGIIAGGEAALTRSIEGAEDDGEAGVAACRERGLGSSDVLVGISANGNPAFVVEALRYAASTGCFCAAISSNPENAMFSLIPPSHRIYVPVGPEIVTGSTRMKSGTAQKLVLNMISTTAMIRMGKVYDNLMVDLHAVNRKLVDRTRRIVEEITGCSSEEAEAACRGSGNDGKVAVVMAWFRCTADKARSRLAAHDGNVRKTLQG